MQFQTIDLGPHVLANDSSLQGSANTDLCLFHPGTRSAWHKRNLYKSSLEAIFEEEFDPSSNARVCVTVVTDMNLRQGQCKQAN